MLLDSTPAADKDMVSSVPENNFDYNFFQQEGEGKPNGSPLAQNAVAGKQGITSEQQKALEDLSYVNNNLGEIASQGSQDQYFYTRPVSYDPETTTNPNQNFERYYSHKSFKDLGFNPWRDNETLYNEKGSVWGDVWRATQGAAKMVPTGFMSALRSYGDVFSGDILAQDQESADAMKRLNVQGMSGRTGVGGFASNLILIFGYTAGLSLEMAAEAGIGALLTPETGGASAGLAIGRIAQNAKNLGNYFNVVKGFNNAINSMKSFSVAKTVYDGFKAAGKFVNPLSSTFEAINLLNASENLTNLAKVSKTAAGFHRDVLMANATLAEAKVEGASANSDLEEELISQFYILHGYTPQDDALLDIKQTAQEAGDAALAWNIPTIMLTNKITFDPLFKKFVPLNDYITKAGAKFIEKRGVGFVEEEFAQGVKGLLKPRVYGKAGLMYFKENFSEGIQESLQDIIASTSQAYYTDIYNNASKQALDQSQAENYAPSVGGLVGKSVADQFSGKGFETFASGFFMGGLIKIQAGAVQGTREAYNRLFNKERYADYKKTKTEYNEKTLGQLNELYKDPLKYFGSRIINYGNATNTIDNQQNAADTDNKKTWHDVDDQNVWSHISTALETGTYDVFLDRIDSIKSMSPEAIKEVYGVDSGEVFGKLDKVLDRANQIKNSYNTWSQKAVNPFQPANYKKGTPEYDKEAIGYSSWEQAKRNAIFYSYSIGRNLERVDAIRSDMESTKSFRDLNSLDITPLFDVKSINKELSLLKTEIDAINATNLPDNKKVLRDKTGKYERLQILRQSLENYFIEQSAKKLSAGEQEKYFGNFKEYKKTSDEGFKKAYKEYIKHAASTNDVYFMNDSEVTSSYQSFKDLHMLNAETRNLTETVNMLANPAGFYDHYDRINSHFTEMFDDRTSNFEKGLEDTYSRTELNILLNNLYRLGYVVDNAEIRELIEKGTVPSKFYNVVSEQIITKESSEAYQTFESIINDYLGAKAGNPITNEEVTIEETISDSEYSDFVDNNNATANRLRLIATKVISKSSLTEREQAVFSGKTSEINSIIEKRAAENNTTQAILPTKENIETYDVDEQLNKIRTGEDFMNYQNTVMAILGNYNRAVEIGIDKETASKLFERLKEKEKTLVEGFTPETLQVGNIVQMSEKRLGKMLVEKINKESVSFKKLGEDETALYIFKKSKLKEAVKFKYSDKMVTETTPALTAAEKAKASKNIETSNILLEDSAALQALQTEADKEGKDKVNKDFMDNLGCK